MVRPIRGRLETLGLLLCLFASLSLGAPQSSLRGRVLDRDGNPLPGVTVVLTDPAKTGWERGGLTDALGSFQLLDVPPGAGYRLSVSLPSYQTLQFSEVEVGSDATRMSDVTLYPSLTERVQVRGTPDIVQTDSAVTRTEISSEFIGGLPVLGRDYQDLLVMAPGVTDVNHTRNPNIHGARDVDVLTLVDGINTTDPFSGKYGMEMNSESIAEIEIITAGATAQYSRAQGGFVNLITKSGGNEFQGNFKIFIRSYRLDGDGAGIDPGEIRGGTGEKDGFRDLRFSDFYPFLSVSGPLVKDHAWYYVAPEFVQVENPTNVGTQAFIVQTRSVRGTAKITWQLGPSHKLSFTGLYDDTIVDNQGVESRVLLESGYSFDRGGPTLTIQDTAIFRPDVSLESAISRLHESFSVIPTLDADTNHNGVLFVDANRLLGGNRDGFSNARERDAGEDFDRDGRYDVFEDYNHNASLDNCYLSSTGERVCIDDIDSDGRVTPPFGCEGREHEDVNCNGSLDRETDLNQDGKVDPNEDRGIPCSNPIVCPGGAEPGTRNNGRFDTEDRNGSGRLDVMGNSGNTPYPFWNDANGDGIRDPQEYRRPLPPDRDYFIDLGVDRTSGPFYVDYGDDRTRDTLREDLSIYLPDIGGTHDLKVGGIWEREGFARVLHQRPALRRTGLLFNPFTHRLSQQVAADLPTMPTVPSEASGDHFGFYLQDTFKPRPNLSFGLGLRFDREEAGAWGYAPFDPSSERRTFDLLTGLVGTEVTSGDLNSDGIMTWDFTQDPLYNSDAVHFQRLASDLAKAAGRRLTRHNYLSTIVSAQLASLGIADPSTLYGGTPRSQEQFSITNNNLAPRLSVSWDPNAAGKTKLFASWGRYYGNLFLQSLVGEQGPDFITPYYVFDTDGVNAQGLPNHQMGRLVSSSPPSATQVNRDIKTPFSDEMTLGWAQEIVPEASVSITYVRKKYREQLQNIDVNHTTRRPPFCKEAITPDGYCDDFGITLPPEKSNDQWVRQSDSYPDLYINNPNFNQVFRVGNYNYQDYVSYEIHFVRRLHRKWQMDASYVFSKAQGQAETFLSESGDDPALTELKDGYMDYDQRHVAKYYAIAYLPADWQLGGGIVWGSGLPYSFANRFQSNDNADFNQFRRLYGSHDLNSKLFHSEPRNNHRNPSTYDISVRAQKNMVWGHSTAGLFMEVFNLLNTDDLRIREIDDQEPSLQANETRLFGRRFQVGIQLNF